jgi:SAM-dependent methyltransferase
MLKKHPPLTQNKMSIYKNPRYYEIAFSFRNIPQEVNFFEKAIKKFSKIKVKKVLELASGTSPYLEEWHKRGYKYLGLDLNQEMLAFAKSRAKEKKINATFFRENMNKFSIRNLKVDLVYLLLGSFYVKSNDEFFEHLDCVSKVLNPGGLYILEGAVWFNIFGNNKQIWTISKEGVRVKTTFEAKVINPLNQTFQEVLNLEVWDNGVKKLIRGGEIRKFFFPQEFLTLIKCHKKFEFLGWFENFDLTKTVSNQPLNRNLVILRKK